MVEDLKKEELNAAEGAVEQLVEKANVAVEKETAESLLAQEGLEGGLKIKRAKGQDETNARDRHNWGVDLKQMCFDLGFYLSDLGRKELDLLQLHPQDHALSVAIGRDGVCGTVLELFRFRSAEAASGCVAEQFCQLVRISSCDRLSGGISFQNGSCGSTEGISKKVLELRE